MMTVAAVWDLLRREVVARESSEVALDQAVGRTLREDVRAPEDQPAFDRSAVDGFVVLQDDASTVFRIVGEIPAGAPGNQTLLPGEAWRIATGAAVPRSSAAEIVMLEEAEEVDGQVRFRTRGRDHIRRRGEDVRAGEIVAEQGMRIGTGLAGLFASIGKVRLAVTKPLEVLHIATGDEIVSPEQAPAAGQVRDANSALVAAWAARHPCRIWQIRIGGEPEALRQAVSGTRDLLLVSGGASVGRSDHTAEVLEAEGFEILVRRVAVRPGKPLIVGRRGDEWAMGLPGNPLSHFACLNVFGEALMAALLGAPQGPAVSRAPMLAAVKGNPRETWWPGCLSAEGIRPLRWASSGDLTALAVADVLIRVPPEGLAAGAPAGFIFAL